jgi:hypothetical protein
VSGSAAVMPNSRPRSIRARSQETGTPTSRPSPAGASVLITIRA